MALRDFRTWSITARLVAIATVPTIVMGAAVTSALYAAGTAEVAAELQDRGRLASAMLVEASRYALVSGNTASLEGTLHSMLRTTPGIAAAEVLNAQRQVLAHAGEPAVSRSLPAFELEVAPAVPDINLFDQAGGAPHVSTSVGTAHLREGVVVGYVRVMMSPGPLMQAKRARLALGAMIVLLATLISVVGGVLIAQPLLRTPLRRMTNALLSLRSGTYRVDLDTTMGGEVGDLNATLVEVAQTLGIAHAKLEQEVAHRTAELQQALEERSRLIANGHTLLEEERERIAREIHDHLNAELIVLRMEIHNAAALAEGGATPDTQAAVAAIFERINGTTKRLYETARRIVKALRPEVIDTLGLAGAVREMVRTYDALHPQCGFELEVSATFPTLRGRQAITVYRLVQEALSNVVKHSKATRVWVRLLHDPTGPKELRLMVSDDGVGFNPTADTAGVGLIGMRERTGASNGTMTIRSATREGRTGTVVDIRIPLDFISEGGGPVSPMESARPPLDC